MAETSSLLNCRTGNRTTSSNLVASAADCKHCDGAIAQLVEQRTENPCVPGSIPGGTTKTKEVFTQGVVPPVRFVLGWFSECVGCKMLPSSQWLFALSAGFICLKK